MANKKVILGSVDLTNVSPDFCWYSIVTRFNYEEMYINNIIQAVDGTDLQALIEDYYVPIKYIKDTDEKKKIHKIKGCFSNYVFIKCKMTDRLWNLLRTTTGVAVVLSTGGIPVAISEEDINDIKEKQKIEGFESKEAENRFLATIKNKFTIGK